MLDIETSPNVAHVWELFNQNVGLSQLMESTYTLCWAAKWYKEKEVYFSSAQKSRPKTMLKGIHKLLSDADAVVHYNGARFDIPTLNKEFLLHGLTPPAPYKQMDLYRVVKERFRFPSNKLEYIARTLGIGKKRETGGHELWVRCMAGDEKAWKTMQEYNIGDVFLLEGLYDKLKPWVKGHANHNLYQEEKTVSCPNCGISSYQRRGFSYTSVGKYPRFMCKGCGAWFRGNKGLIPRVQEVYVSE